MTEETSKDFLKLAKKDLTISKGQIMLLNMNYDDAYISSLCYYTSQTVEKILKSIMLNYKEKISYSHRIAKLIRDVEDIGEKVPSLITNSDTDIEDWSNNTRYNVNYLGDYKLAIEIVNICEEWIDNLEQVNGVTEKENNVKGF